MTEYDRKLIECEKDREPSFCGGGDSVLVCAEKISKITNKQLEDASFIGVFC